MHVEAFIKSLNRNEKLLITKNPESLIEKLKQIEDLKCSITVFDYKIKI